MNCKFLKMEIKKALKMFPKMFCVAALLLLIVAGISFAGIKYFYKEASTIQINVAIVDESPNDETNFALSYIQQIEGLSENCNFIITEKEKGFKMLEEGKVSALLYLPSNVISGILNGTNIPAQVYFPENSSVESTILKEYIKSAVSMLKTAQAQIYSINDVAIKFDKTDKISRFEWDVNFYNLSFALNRISLYSDADGNGTGNLSLIQYYIVSGVMLFLLLFGMALSPIMKKYNKAFLYKANQLGVGNMQLLFNKTITMFLVYLLTFYFTYFLISIFIEVPVFGVKEHFSILLIILCVTTFIQIIYVITNENASSILFIFFITIFTSYASGAIIPTLYLPKIVQNISLFLPTTYIKKAIADVYLIDVNTSTLIILLLFSTIFMTINIFFKRMVKDHEIY